MNNISSSLVLLLDSYLSCGDSVVVGADASKDNLCIWVHPFNQVGKLKPYWEDVKALVDSFCARDLVDLDDKKPKAKYHLSRLYANKSGVATLLFLKTRYRIQALVMEPTGFAYTDIWARICKAEEIPIRWVGHQEIAAYRRSHRLPNKNDLSDAVAIAHYAIANWDNPEHFLSFQPDPIHRIREIYLQLGSLARIQSPIVNRCRQNLCTEFPEAAFKASRQSPADGVSPLLSFLAQTPRPKLKNKSTYYERLYTESIAPIYKVDISLFTRRLAETNVNIHAWEAELEVELDGLISQPEFSRYKRVFDLMGMGSRTQAIILAQVYPIERFAKFNRLTQKYQYSKSLGAFKQRLGYGGEQSESGDVERRKSSGSKLARKALYLYVLTKIAPLKARISTEPVSQLATFYDSRMSRFSYEDWVKRQVKTSQLSLIDDLFNQLKRSMEDWAFSSVAEELMRQRRQIELQNFDLRSAENKPGLNESHKGYGSLVISQTAAKAARILFKLLSKCE